MEYSYPITPNILFADLVNGPQIKRKGPFWDALNDLIHGDDIGAYAQLEEAYLEEGYFKRRNTRFDLISTRARYHYPVQNDTDWVEFLAQANAQGWLLNLTRLGRIAAVHAVQAMIESRHPFIACDAFDLEKSDADALLRLFKIETDVIESSLEKNRSLSKWLHHRQRKAEKLLKRDRLSTNAAA